MNDTDLITRDVLLEFGFTCFGEACMWSYSLGDLSVMGISPQKPHEGSWTCRNKPMPHDWACGIYQLPPIQTIGQLKRRIDDLGVSGENETELTKYATELDLNALGFKPLTETSARIRTKVGTWLVFDWTSKPWHVRIGTDKGGTAILTTIIFAITLERILADLDLLPKVTT